MRRSPLFERERELERVAEACRAASRGSAGVVLVEGDAGVGKTSILNAASVSAEAEGLRVLTARGRELEQNHGYGIARQLLAPICDEAQAAGHFAGSARFARDVLTGATNASGDAFAVWHGLYWLLANRSAVEPVALVVDDAHWADPPSLKWLAFSAARLDGLSVVLVVATRRTRQRPPEIEGLRNAETSIVVSVPPLSRSATAAVIRTVKPDVHDDFSDACHALTGGNPFLLHALLDEVGQTGVSADPSGVPELSALPHEPVAAHVLQRLQPLGIEAVALAEALAVAGDGGHLRHAAALARMPMDDAELTADALATARVLSSAEPIRFVHPLVADAIKAQIPSGRWSAWHRRVARLLEAEGDTERAAAHLLAVDPAGEAWIVERLRAEARRALANGDGHSAASLVERALREPPLVGGRGRLLADLGEAELVTGSAASVGHLREAYRLAADPDDIARSARLLATALTVHGPVKEAGVVLEEALSALGADDARGAALRVEMLTIAQASHALAGRTQDVLQHAGRQATGSSAGDAMVLAALGYQQAITWSAPAATAVANLNKAFELGLVSTAGSDSTATGIAVTALVLAGAVDAADRVIADVFAHARATGSSRGLAQASVLRARAACSRGAFDEAEIDATIALEIGRAAYPMLVPFPLAVLVLASCARGTPGAAEDLLVAHGMVDGDLPPTSPGAVLLVMRMMLRRATGDLDAATADLARLDDFVAGRGVYPRTWVPEIVATMSAGGRTAEALDLASEHLEAAYAWGSPPDIAEALRCLASLQSARALDLLGEAAQVVENAATPWQRASTLADFGAALRRNNRRAAARPLLAEALDIAHRCGAVPLATRVRDELQAAGARPRRLARTGVDALTPSERRIARMAADGLTNSDIAQALFITRKTVEKHLSSTYTKLDITSRAELITLLSASSSRADS